MAEEEDETKAIMIQNVPIEDYWELKEKKNDSIESTWRSFFLSRTREHDELIEENAILKLVLMEAYGIEMEDVEDHVERYREEDETEEDEPKSIGGFVIDG